jgi:hypothetical protein
LRIARALESIIIAATQINSDTSSPLLCWSQGYGIEWHYIGAHPANSQPPSERQYERVPILDEIYRDFVQEPSWHDT